MKADLIELTNYFTAEEIDGEDEIMHNFHAVSSGSIDLPAVFDSQVREDLIQRAVVSAQANRRQSHGPSPYAGRRHSVSTWGKGRGTARVQRLKQGRTAAESPNNVGGGRAHPPKPWEDWSKKINRKEAKIAWRAALAATADADIVRSRGHRFEDGFSFPLVLSSKLQEYNATNKSIPDDLSEMQDVEFPSKKSFTQDLEEFHSEEMEEGEAATLRFRQVAAALGLRGDIERAREGRHVRAGRGRRRGRKHRQPRSILLVVASRDGLARAAKNLAGVDVADVENLSTELLAPGGHAGRLTIYTEEAIKRLGEITE